MANGAQREERLAYDAILNGNFDAAKQHLLKASNYRWWKGWLEGAGRDRERALNEQAMKQEAAFVHGKRDEERADALLRFDYLKDARARDEGVTEAKRLLLRAAENWHSAGRFEDEERVCEREKSVQLGPWIDFSPDQAFDPDAYLAKKIRATSAHDSRKFDPSTANPFDIFDQVAPAKRQILDRSTGRPVTVEQFLNASSAASFEIVELPDAVPAPTARVKRYISTDPNAASDLKPPNH